MPEIEYLDTNASPTIQFLDEPETIYREDTDQLIEAPSGLSADEIKYLDDTQNRGHDKNHYFGNIKLGNPIDFAKGYIGSVVANVPELFMDTEGKERKLQKLKEFETGQRQLDLFDWFTMKPSEYKAIKLGDTKALQQEITSQILAQNEYREKLPAILEGMGLSADSTVLGSLGGGVQSLAQTIGITMVTGNPLAASGLMGLQEKNRTYAEGREAGLSIDAAGEAAALNASQMAFIEAIGTRALFKTFGESTILKRAFKGFLTEGMEEGSQELLSILIKNGYDITDTSFEEGAGQVLYAAMIGGLIGAPVSAVAGPSINEDMKRAGDIVAEWAANNPDVQNIAKQEVVNQVEAQIRNGDQAAAKAVLEGGKPLDTPSAIDEQADIDTFLNEYVDQTENQGAFAAPKMAWDNVKLGAAKLAEPISSRLGKISKPLMYRLRRFEMDTKVSIQRGEKAIVPFLKKWRGLDEKTKSQLDYVLKNGTEEQVQEFAKRVGMGNEIEAVRQTLDDIYSRAKDAGVGVEYRSSFFPRHVEDTEGLLAYLRKKELWTPIQQAIETKEKSVGRSLSDAEKAEIANTLLRGFKVGGVSLKDSGVFGERTIEEITPEINKFYTTTDQALLRYIVVANENIETKNLFGVGADTGDILSAQSSIGEMVNSMIDSGEIDTNQAREIKDILGARFNRGRMGPVAETFKNFSYIETMGTNIGSTLTQIGDISFSIMRNGFFRAFGTWPSSWLPKNQQILDEIGINQIAQEYQNGRFTSKVLDKVFKLTGLHTIDRVGKATLVNSSLKRLRSEAKKGNAELSKQLDYMFGDKASAVMQDLKDGNVTEDVKFLMFNELLEMQPVALSEMPEQYLRSGNGRIFYILKSFTIKQIDVYRRYGVDMMKDGIANKDIKTFAKGAKNFFTLAIWLTAMGVTKDYLWDMMRGEEPEELDDAVVENIFKAFGLSKYDWDTLNRPYMPETAGSTLFGYILPPTKTLDNVWRDYKTISGKKDWDLKDLRTLRSVPVGGELYWFWFGGGSDKKPSKSGSNSVIYKGD